MSLFGKTKREGFWYKEDHLFEKATYRCSRCGAVFRERRDVCPRCGSENRREKTDPVWVDEMALIDED